MHINCRRSDGDTGKRGDKPPFLTASEIILNQTCKTLSVRIQLGILAVRKGGLPPL
jgi:hypothetical protein